MGTFYDGELIIRFLSRYSGQNDYAISTLYGEKSRLCIPDVGDPHFEYENPNSEATRLAKIIAEHETSEYEEFKKRNPNLIYERKGI